MKKLLLSLTTALLGLAASAANITESFTDEKACKTWLPTAANTTGTDVCTSPVTNITYTLQNIKCMGYQGAGYLMLYGSNPKATMSFSLPIACSEIKVLTGKSASTSAAIEVKVGDDVIAGPTTLNAKDASFSFIIPAANQAAGTTYTIAVTGTKNAQFQSIEFVEATSDPVLESTISGTTQFAVPLNGSMTCQMGVKAANLPTDIAVAVYGDGFSVDKSSITVAEAAEGVNVTYTGSAAGTVSGVLNFTCGSLQVEYPLSAYTAVNAGTEASPLTASEVVTMNNLNAGPYWVTGSINAMGAANAADGVLQLATAASASNLVIGDGTNIIAVALPSGDVRSALNVVDNPDNVGKTLNIKGDLLAHFQAPGLKNPTEFNIDGQSVAKTAAKPYFTPAAGEVKAGTEVQIASATPGAVIYYTTDGSTPSASKGTEFDPGDPIVVNAAMTIKAIATASGYNDSPVAEAAYTVASGTPDVPDVPVAGTISYNFRDLSTLTPNLLPMSEDNGWVKSMSKEVQNGWYYDLDGKQFTAGATSISFTKGEATTSPRIWQSVANDANNGDPDLRVYKKNSMTIAGVNGSAIAITGKNLTKCTVTGATADAANTDTAATFVATADQMIMDQSTATLNFYTITIPPEASGIQKVENANEDVDATVQYFNLQGQAIANPAQGSLVIRRQGSKVAKVIL